ncbi:GIY-YIG nuclease family protein [Streptomyces sp. NPDC087525]|uniref:GIY-YIG nuclease family protein n=1 Tax=Streptomyces sp. NPDC087525 TaxID=3365793 RepID=UPI0037FBB960
MQGLVRARMIHRAEGEEVALYRFFDEAEKLLYVGISKDPMHRWEEHRAKSWWSQIATYEVVWYASRAEARGAEKEAMRSESPTDNIHSAPGHSAHWKAALGSPEARAARKLRGSKRPAKKEQPDG